MQFVNERLKGKLDKGYATTIFSAASLGHNNCFRQQMVACYFHLNIRHNVQINFYIYNIKHDLHGLRLFQI